MQNQFLADHVLCHRTRRRRRPNTPATPTPAKARPDGSGTIIMTPATTFPLNGVPTPPLVESNDWPKNVPVALADSVNRPTLNVPDSLGVVLPHDTARSVAPF